MVENVCHQNCFTGRFAIIYMGEPNANAQDVLDNFNAQRGTTYRASNFATSINKQINGQAATIEIHHRMVRCRVNQNIRWRLHDFNPVSLAIVDDGQERFMLLVRKNNKQLVIVDYDLPRPPAANAAEQNQPARRLPAPDGIMSLGLIVTVQLLAFVALKLRRRS